MDENEELKLGHQSWLKKKESLEKEGYREGAAAGREEAFQKGFDLGYNTGFSSGEKMGFLNGILRTINEQDDAKIILDEAGVIYSPFKLASRGACVVCPPVDKVLTKEEIANSVIHIDEPVENVVGRQEKIVDTSTCEKRTVLKLMLQTLKKGDHLFEGKL